MSRPLPTVRADASNLSTRLDLRRKVFGAVQRSREKFDFGRWRLVFTLFGAWIVTMLNGERTGRPKVHLRSSTIIPLPLLHHR